MDAALLERRHFRDRAFLQVALGTGFRVSEILGLTWSQILTPFGEISDSVTIERAQLKGGAGVRRKAIRSRRVPLNERVRSAIADYLGSLNAVPVGPVFMSRVGTDRPITRVQAHRLLKDLSRELGFDCQRLGCHSARKHFAQAIWRKSGFNLLQVQRLVTAAYLDSNRDELDALVLGLDQTPAVPLAMPLVASAGTSDRFGDGFNTGKM